MNGWPELWGQDEAKAAGVPLGHSIGAHQHLGWGACCNGVTPAGEMLGWRTLATGHPAPDIRWARAVS